MPDLNPPPVLPAQHDLHNDDSFDLEHNDEKIFLKAVKLHGPGPLQPISLKEQCMYFFISRAAEWLSMKNKTSINIFDSMPSFLRAQLLKYLSGYVWRNLDCDADYEWAILLPPHLICPLINLVVGKNIKKMDLGSMICAFEVNDDVDMKKTDITGGVIDILSKLSEDSPNLQEFTMECSFHRAYSFDQQQLLKHLLIKECKFKNLTALSLTFLGVCGSKIGNKSLKDICSNFPLLVYLRLELAKNIKLKALVESLSNLKRLRFFSYNFVDYDEFMMRPQRHPLEDKTFNYCAPKLPHLEHLRVVEIPEEQTAFCSEEHSLMFSGTCQLRHLCCINELPKASLPNLSDLCFKGPILNMAVFDSRVSLYKNLTTVQLQNVEEERVCLLLELVGHQLSVLLLSSPMRFSDFKIVSLCPNLVKLLNCGQAYYRHSLESLRYADERNVRMMCSLKYLNLDFKGTRAPQGLLKMLLASPKLEKLFIYEMLISAKDCRFLSQLKCPSLERLLFFDMKPTLDCQLAHFQVMVRGLAVHLPSLVGMEILLDTSFREGLANWDANVKKYIDLFLCFFN